MQEDEKIKREVLAEEELRTRNAAERKRVEDEKRHRLVSKITHDIHQNSKSPEKVWQQTPDERTHLSEVQRLGLTGLLKPDLEPAYCFHISPERWQAMIINGFILYRLRHGYTSPFHTTDIHKWFRENKIIRSPYSAYIDIFTERDVKLAIPSFRTPYKTIENYLQTMPWVVRKNRRKRWDVTDQFKFELQHKMSPRR